MNNVNEEPEGMGECKEERERNNDGTVIRSRGIACTRELSYMALVVMFAMVLFVYWPVLFECTRKTGILVELWQDIQDST